MSKIQYYNEKTLAIDLIQDYYKTDNPVLIVKKAKEDLDIIISLSDVFDYLSCEPDDLEKESYTISMKDFFVDGEFSRKESNLS